ncbi:flap endonuclease GEN-like 1 [Macadamia integrifolia]|uniref:flap endonuclease GEN-like 1 n=1 Tax=Macadamia integrifolia TaxID=60698 RepID=UPI001C4F1B90|nr:flap endonuclease GEN-like 1 [Macadamia integrifolia]
MGVGGNFWDLLKPYARNEDFDFLRNKRVAVDLSFWIVQHETAIGKNARNPHLRVTFFRTINLFSKFGAFPVFVVDGIPSPLKSRARIERFFRSSGIDVTDIQNSKERVSVERNRSFTKSVRECVELLELLGMPVLTAKSEAEALCAQLNSDGHVDACITADSDAFLFGAKCVIKCLRPNSKEPFECYCMSDIEAGLGLKRKQLVAISLLVGNDHDLNGVQGIGLDTALRFVRMFPEDEILNRLREAGRGEIPFQDGNKPTGDCYGPSTNESSSRMKSTHCSYCGHPGNKSAHLKLACKYCAATGNENCMQKPAGFKCECSSCDMDRKSKELKKHKNWQINVCRKIAIEKNFPNNGIIEMCLSDQHGNFTENEGPSLKWENPRTETLVDFLVYHQQWEPSYIRQRMLPMLSTIFLREKASSLAEGLLLYGQYEFNSIQQEKIRYGHPFYVVKWKKADIAVLCGIHMVPTEQSDQQTVELGGVSESLEDEPDVPKILVANDCWFLTTDENMELVQTAFPEKVETFLQEKAMKESKSLKNKSSSRSGGTKGKVESKSSGVQLSITEFYRSTKVLVQSKQGEDPSKISASDGGAENLKRGRKMSSPNLPKSVRRRLLFE